MNSFIRKYRRFKYLVLITALSFCTTTTKQNYSSTNNFVTWENPCFDRSASIWLMEQFVDSTASFEFMEFGKKITNGIPFDVPGAELGRQKNICCFESIILKYRLNDPSIIQIAKVIHDIDVNKWGIKMYSESDSLESIFNQYTIETFSDQELVAKSAQIFNNMYKKYSK